MALWSEMQAAPKTGDIGAESTGEQFGEIVRDYKVKPGVSWRFGKPNYSRVNKTYFENRSKKHPEGSLEAVVSKVVKNWEVDSHHVLKPSDWRTMNVDKFKISVNGGPKASAQAMADVGPYVALLGDIPGVFYASQNTFASTNKIFSEVFPEGFAWEVLEVFQGPPKVTFKWRHFGKFTGKWVAPDGTEYKGTGEMLNLEGICVAAVDSNLIIEELEIYYNPLDQILPLLKGQKTAPPSSGGFFGMCATPAVTRDVTG
eukprot:TRINITY_DN3677_c0_g1_i11.p2 TRINITY_DN3677_c0_g1~~TRINITY_DN3677_c0_g1_i11.p2  ORF type:complete len:258 (-),score=58.61 TRINITY_DN3677_c0_g1_i11:85-858(-)